MHELGIASSILETVEKEADKRSNMRFQKVGLRIGELAGIDIDTLMFGWEAIVKDTNGNRWCWRSSVSRARTAVMRAIGTSRYTTSPSSTVRGAMRSLPST